MLSCVAALTGLLALPGAAQVERSASVSARRSPRQQNAFATAPAADRGAAALWQTLQKLGTRASLMMIVAHPDDEDGGLLAYESRAVGADTSLLTLNRGEGGQNLMSADLWDRLGLLRTEELLAADQRYGVHQYFTRVADFGFSKTLEESLKVWGHDRVLYDCVRAVREARPLVVLSVFAGNVSDGHGQHQVSGLMAQEVYKFAGDPKIFPDQIAAGLRPWSALKVYARVPFARVTDKGIYDYATGHWEPVRFRNYVTGETMNGVPSTTLEVPEGEYQPLFGESYLQLAREGLGEQKSQNGGLAPPLLRPFGSPYHLYASRTAGDAAGLPAHEDSFFEGIDTSLAGMAAYAPAADQPIWRQRLESLQAQVSEAVAAYRAERPEATAPALARGLSLTRTLQGEVAASSLPAEGRANMEHELATKEQQFEAAMSEALSLDLSASVTEANAIAPASPFSGIQPTFLTAVAGQPLNIAVHVADGGRDAVEVTQAHIAAPGGGEWTFAAAKGSTALTGPLAAASARDELVTTTTPADAPVTKPYFTRPNLEQSFYDLNVPQDLDLPEMPYPLAADLTYRYAGVEAHLSTVVQGYEKLLGPGPTAVPLRIAPAISVTVSPAAGIIPLGTKTLQLTAAVQSNVKGPASGTLQLELPGGWRAEPQTASFSTARDGEERLIAFTVTPGSVSAEPYAITAVANYNGQQFREGFTEAGYAGLRPYPWFRPATYRTTGTDVSVAPGLRVAYVMGTGDDVAESMADLGIHPVTLSSADLATEDLSQFDTIVLGVRTFAAKPELATLNARLLAYVHAGGTLVVQYQSAEFDHNYGPFPLTLSSDAEKVVEENGAVTLTLPADPLLNWPNHITGKDFDGWVEERGHGFMRAWDAHYIAPLAMHDTGQESQSGGLLYARDGQGLYIYTSLAFFREMPEGVPGAFRLMANLLSAAKNPAFANKSPAPQ